MSQETTVPPNYAGDLTPKEAWAQLQSDPETVLIDVRSSAEWTFVGVPDLSSIGGRLITQSWQIYPAMEIDGSFIPKLKAEGLKADQPLLFLCRSGVRSVAAATLATALGFRRCYNIVGGFEGPVDGEKHRNTIAGWKHDGLPWVQS